MWCKSQKVYKIKSYISYMLALFFVVGFFVLLYFGFLKKNMIMTSNNICIADFMILINNNSFVYTVIIPLCVLVINILSEHNFSNFNYYIRNNSRSGIILKRIGKVFIFSTVVSAIIIATAILDGGILSRELMNWQRTDSYFYMLNRYTFEASFMIVLIFEYIKLFFALSFYSTLFCMLSIIWNKAISLIPIVLLSGFNILYMIIAFFNRHNDSVFTEYMDTVSIILTFAVYPLLTAVVIWFAVKLVKRKDFFV